MLPIYQAFLDNDDEELSATDEAMLQECQKFQKGEEKRLKISEQLLQEIHEVSQKLHRSKQPDLAYQPLYLLHQLFSLLFASSIIEPLLEGFELKVKILPKQTDGGVMEYQVNFAEIPEVRVRLRKLIADGESTEYCLRRVFSKVEDNNLLDVMIHLT